MGQNFHKPGRGSRRYSIDYRLSDWHHAAQYLLKHVRMPDIVWKKAVAPSKVDHEMHNYDCYWVNGDISARFSNSRQLSFEMQSPDLNLKTSYAS